VPFLLVYLETRLSRSVATGCHFHHFGGAGKILNLFDLESTIAAIVNNEWLIVAHFVPTRHIVRHDDGKPMSRYFIGSSHL
jgi:hypothetical protein